jgi:nucleoside-diphosphate-sugar epimerase
MRIFITGATGVIGRRVVPLCLKQGHQVTAIARSPEKGAALERQGASPVTADLFEREQLVSVLAGHDAVLNLATHLPKSALRMMLPGAWRENDRIRREGSATLVSAALAAGVGRFVQESFGPAYPDRGSAWVDESTPIPPHHYSRAITDAERSAARFSEGGGVGVVLRFAAFYGPDGRFFADIVRAVQRGIAPLFGPPEAFISSVSHDDAATAVVAALQLPGGIYNVVDDEPVTHREYAESLADALGVKHPKLLPPWATMLGGSRARMLARSLRMSNKKLRDASGWSPIYRSVREGWPDAVTPFLTGKPAPELHPAR